VTFPDEIRKVIFEGGVKGELQKHLICPCVCKPAVNWASVHIYVKVRTELFTVYPEDEGSRLLRNICDLLPD
jgi:hypothetical protein